MAAYCFFLPLLEPQCQPQSNCRDQGLASAVHAVYNCPAEHQVSKKHSEYDLNYCHMEKGGSKTHPRRPPAALIQHIVLTYYLVLVWWSPDIQSLVIRLCNLASIQTVVDMYIFWPGSYIALFMTAHGYHFIFLTVFSAELSIFLDHMFLGNTSSQ